MRDAMNSNSLLGMTSLSGFGDAFRLPAFPDLAATRARVLEACPPSFQRLIVREECAMHLVMPLEALLRSRQPANELTQCRIRMQPA